MRRMADALLEEALKQASVAPGLLDMREGQI
jgi:hypothetical protein